MDVSQYADFAQYLAKLWNGEFSHCYRVTSRPAWQRWRNICPTSDKSIWQCSSLKQAAEHYSWAGDDASKVFKELSSQLMQEVKNGDNCAAASTCKAIFKWGGVARNPNDASLKWIDARSASRTLCERLTDANRLLSVSHDGLDRFDGCDLLMNSAMTKVYAANSPDRLIIYDGRVGAALGLIARDYLQSKSHQGRPPAHLAFLWGASTSKKKPNERNPSEGEIRFSRLFGINKDRRHAEMMRGTSILLRKVADTIPDGATSTLHRLEQALFMVGYDVSRKQPV